MEVAPRERPGRQKKMVTYTVSDDDSDDDYQFGSRLGLYKNLTLNGWWPI